MDNHPTLLAVADGLLAARMVLVVQLKGVEKRLVDLARGDTRVQPVMSAPEVGVIVAHIHQTVRKHFAQQHQSHQTPVRGVPRPVAKSCEDAAATHPSSRGTQNVEADARDRAFQPRTAAINSAKPTRLSARLRL